MDSGPISTLTAEELQLRFQSSNILPAVISDKLFEGLGLSLGHKMKLLNYVKTIKQLQEQEELANVVIVDPGPILEIEAVVNENQLLDIVVPAEPSNNNGTSNRDVNVIEILNETDEGNMIVGAYMERLEAFITEDERITIVQILVNNLVTKNGKLDLFPPREQRRNLGEAIVWAFPCLGFHVDGKVYSSHFYNQSTGSGFIKARLKRLRESNRDERRRNRPLQDPLNPVFKKARIIKRPNMKINGYIFNEVECRFKVEWMKSHPPGGENDSVIEEYMKATFGYRQKQIRTSLTEPGLVMAEYPGFKDFQNGSLFFSDFKLLYPEAKDFDKSFKEKYLNEIFLLANRKSVDIPESPDGKQTFIFICPLPCTWSLN
ncbi:uncharacterized protein LOC116926182 isoform X3 [Daphnia magna]|uniref:uncharacterized protein LOC116926182 isoform X3 n=1 Tax=Daphnia magna TaxID=35525 RepID=UPI001E1BD0F3|nr:uncharacterized protein LOC116926182 isoform X3 [Daphnia magna]